MSARKLPALAVSLRWYKREVVRSIRRSIAGFRSPGVRSAMFEKLIRVRAMKPAAFRAEYIAHRVGEIRRAPLAELRVVVPSLAILTCTPVTPVVADDSDDATPRAACA